MRETLKQTIEVIMVKKVWLVVSGVVTTIAAIVIPVVTGYAAYSRSMSAMEDKINAVQVEAAKTMVTREDLRELKAQLEVIRATQVQTAQEIGNLRGLIERRK